MKKFLATFISLVFIAGLAISPVWAAGDKVRSDKAVGPAGSSGKGKVATKRGNNAGKRIKTPATLSDKEAAWIMLMRQEEKLARDVYLTLYDVFKERIFRNISRSEQRHMNAVLNLIDKFGLEDPIVHDTIGEFPDKDFQSLYESFVKEGSANLCSALQVGIELEELDIDDLDTALEELDDANTSIIRVFNNLLNGSYNHLNAFENCYKRNSCK